MYLNHLCTDRELIETAQYAENPHLRLLAERLDDKLVIIHDARDALGKGHKIELSKDVSDLITKVQNILER
jgi:hypothetical protein